MTWTCSSSSNSSSLKRRICISAVGGLLIGTFVVFIIFIRPSLYQGPQQQILPLYHEVEMQYLSKGKQPPPLLDELVQQTFWLWIAQNEINCFPFLLICAGIGPLVILLREGRNNTGTVSKSLKVAEWKQAPSTTLPVTENVSDQSVVISLKEPNLQDQQ